MNEDSSISSELISALKGFLGAISEAHDAITVPDPKPGPFPHGLGYVYLKIAIGPNSGELKLADLDYKGPAALTDEQVESMPGEAVAA